MYSIQGGIVSAACLCLVMGNDMGMVQAAHVPYILGGFMISNTAYHFLRLKWKEWTT
jgi:hypothetical protein